MTADTAEALETEAPPVPSPWPLAEDTLASKDSGGWDYLFTSSPVPLPVPVILHGLESFQACHPATEAACSALLDEWAAQARYATYTGTRRRTERAATSVPWEPGRGDAIGRWVKREPAVKPETVVIPAVEAHTELVPAVEDDSTENGAS